MNTDSESLLFKITIQNPGIIILIKIIIQDY